MVTHENFTVLGLEEESRTLMPKIEFLIANHCEFGIAIQLHDLKSQSDSEIATRIASNSMSKTSAEIGAEIAVIRIAVIWKAQMVWI